jgi:hypothetical protein
VIQGATKSAYQVRTADVGFRIRVRVTASNADGSASAASNPTAIVTAAGKKPVSTSPPTISGTPAVGQTLTANQGTWSGSQPISYGVQWRRCDKIGGSCSSIGGATGRTYALKSVDLGNTLRIAVTARNAAGTTSATSVPTAVITAGLPPPAATGCPTGSGLIQVADLTSPARLLIDQQQSNPSAVTRGTQQLIVRYHVTACGGRPVQGALVYSTAVPFNQFTVPAEQPTNRDGFAELDFRVLSSFPLSPKQGLLVMFARARKPGENLLGGISTRRRFSIHVNQ